MGQARNPRTILAVMAVLLVITGVSAYAAITILSNEPGNNDNVESDSVVLTLLENAGVMIEANDMRIYVDPIELNSSFADLDADAILITHPHGDHYQANVIEMLQKEDTVNIFPMNMTTEISYHEGVGVNPGDSVMVGDINITAFWMYTFPVDIYPASHPREANWTSYIIDIDGFTIFHAGDSKNIVEYSQLSGQIDVALLPLGPGCQTMVDAEIVWALAAIGPTYYIPIHYAEGACETWTLNFGDDITCDMIMLAYYESHTFENS